MISGHYDSGRWLVTGASGRLGHRLCRWLQAGDREVLAVRHREPVSLAGIEEQEIDLTDAAAVNALVNGVTPRFIVHCAALADVDACEANPEKAHRINVDTTAALAAVAAEVGARFVLISTDQLWDGTRAMLTEDEPPCPINTYGRTKHEAEQAALNTGEGVLVLRVNFFGGGRPGHQTFSDWICTGLDQKRPLTMFTDVFFTPIETSLLCANLVLLAEDGPDGIFHLVGAERLSKYDFALRLAELIGADASQIVATSVTDAGLAAPRPADMSLSSEKISGFLRRPMPDIDESLSRLVAEKV